MTLPEEGSLLRIFIGERDRHGGQPIMVESVDSRERLESACLHFHRSGNAEA